jgi:hypothetical protein
MLKETTEAFGALQTPATISLMQRPDTRVRPFFMRGTEREKNGLTFLDAPRHTGAGRRSLVQIQLQQPNFRVRTGEVPELGLFLQIRA